MLSFESGLLALRTWSCEVTVGSSLDPVGD